MPPKSKSSAWPIVRIQESPEIATELLPQLLREINDRQWQCVLQILVEAKLKAEGMLRNDAIFESPGKVAFYTGWLAYSDYVIESFKGLREQRLPAREERRPGPEEF